MHISNIESNRNQTKKLHGVALTLLGQKWDTVVGLNFTLTHIVSNDEASVPFCVCLRQLLNIKHSVCVLHTIMIIPLLEK